MSHLTDRVALVRGASSGIGRAAASALAVAGAKVVLAARREVELARLGDETGETVDAASCVTGTTVIVDGGLTMTF